MLDAEGVIEPHLVAQSELAPQLLVACMRRHAGLGPDMGEVGEFHACRSFLFPRSLCPFGEVCKADRLLLLLSPRAGRRRPQGALRGSAHQEFARITTLPLNTGEAPHPPRFARRPLPSAGRGRRRKRSRGASSRPGHADDEANKRQPGMIFVRRRRWWNRRPSRSGADVARMSAATSGNDRTDLKGRSRIIAALIRATKKKGKRNAERRCCVTSASRDAARALRGALASRRSTTALAAATERHRSARATRLPGTRSERPPRWFERRSASQRTTRKPTSRPPMRHSRALPAPCCPSPARLHPQSGHDAVRACLAQAAREPR